MMADTMQLRPRAAGRAGAPRGGRFKGAMASEWTKLWSLRSTWLTLVAAVAMQAVYVFFTSASIASQNESGRADAMQSSAPESAVDAVFVSQLAVITLAVLVIASEYATGSIRSTLQWVPVRSRMLLAKCAVVGPVLLATGVVMGAVGVAVADVVLGEYGTEYGSGNAVRAIVGIGLVMALCGMLTIGLGAVLRSVASTMAVAFVLLLIVPMILQMSKVPVLEKAVDYLPSMAGQRFMLGDGEHYPDWLGLGILAGWTVALLAAGYLVLRERDA